MEGPCQLKAKYMGYNWVHPVKNIISLRYSKWLGFSTETRSLPLCEFKNSGPHGATMETIGILDGFCWRSLIWVISPPRAPQGSQAPWSSKLGSLASRSAPRREMKSQSQERSNLSHQERLVMGQRGCGSSDWTHMQAYRKDTVISINSKNLVLIEITLDVPGGLPAKWPRHLFLPAGQGRDASKTWAMVEYLKGAESYGPAKTAVKWQVPKLWMSKFCLVQTDRPKLSDFLLQILSHTPHVSSSTYRDFPWIRG